MIRTFKVLSLIVFILSAGVHALTFAPGISISMHFVWPLHVATIAVFGVMCFTLKSIQKQSPKTASDSLKLWLRVVKSAWPMILLCVASVFYTAENFSRCMALMRNGSPAQKDGKYYLESHGKKIRDINKDEYDRLRINEVRAFSGHWILFTLLPVTFFFFVYPALMRHESGGDAGGGTEPDATNNLGE